VRVSRKFLKGKVKTSTQPLASPQTIFKMPGKRLTEIDSTSKAGYTNTLHIQGNYV
jgi:hypothetical protein